MRKQDGRFNEYPSRNLLINGDMRVDQRGKHGAGAVGEFAFDRWKITTATDMTQIVEEGNYKPATVHTLSGDGVTTQQVTSPASGHWTIPNIPLTARNVQLEEGSVATEFERFPLSLTEMLCYRYYWKAALNAGNGGFYYGEAGQTGVGCYFMFNTKMRASPTVSVDSPVYHNCTDLDLGGDEFGLSHRVSIVALGSYRVIQGVYTADAELL